MIDYALHFKAMTLKLRSFLLKGTISAGNMHSPVEANLDTTRRGIFASVQPLQKLSKISQQTASAITKECL